jgi:hypothetical protein
MASQQAPTAQSQPAAAPAINPDEEKYFAEWSNICRQGRIEEKLCGCIFEKLKTVYPYDQFQVAFQTQDKYFYRVIGGASGECSKK